MEKSTIKQELLVRRDQRVRKMLIINKSIQTLQEGLVLPERDRASLEGYCWLGELAYMLGISDELAGREGILLRKSSITFEGMIRPLLLVFRRFSYCTYFFFHSSLWL